MILKYENHVVLRMVHKHMGRKYTFIIYVIKGVSVRGRPLFAYKSINGRVFQGVHVLTEFHSNLTIY